MTNTLPKEFTDYCEKNGLPDSIGVYALWNAWKDSEDFNKCIIQSMIDCRTCTKFNGKHCNSVSICVDGNKYESDTQLSKWIMSDPEKNYV